VKDFSSARVKLAGCPKRTVLSLCEVLLTLRGSVNLCDRRNSQHKIWHTKVRRRPGRYEGPRALAVSGRSTA